MALPNLAVVGFPKCGSTTLYGEFSQAPDIMTVPVDESTAFIGPTEVSNSIAMLEAKFYGAYAGQRYLADMHPALAYSRGDLKRIRSLCGDIKIICMVRDPWLRSLSNYKHGLRWLAENRSMADAFQADLDDPVTDYQFDGRTIKHHLSLSRYEVFIPRLWDIFGRENVLCLQFEDYFDPEGQDRARLIAWLGLDDARFPQRGLTHHNKGGTWVFKTEEDISFTLNGQEVRAKRFAGVMDERTGNYEWFVVEPSPRAWAWFQEAQKATYANLSFDPQPFSRTFEDTVAFCEQEVFGRALTAWGNIMG